VTCPHLQVSCKRQTEEASTKAALAEAALSVAREEARAAAGKVEALTTQLTAAEDALKVGPELVIHQEGTCVHWAAAASLRCRHGRQ
jgi:hypothetical protein